MEKIVIGSDFECVVIDAEGKIDRHFFGFSQEQPFISDDGYYLNMDGASLECSIPPYVFDPSDPLQFYKEVNKGLDVLKRIVESFSPGASVVFQDCVRSDFSTYSKSWESNIYTGVNSALLNGVRCHGINNGFHIHFSGISEYKKISAIKKLDLLIGIPYKIINLFNKGRYPYGALGSFRDCNYNPFYRGFEYRTLGASMLKEKRLKYCSKQINSILKKLLKENGAV